MKKQQLRFVSDVAINSIVRFPHRHGLFKVESICDGLVFLSKVEKYSQLSFVPSMCTVYVVEGF